MIRDGRMPSPERAKKAREERLDRRRQQPAAQRRRAQRQEQRKAWNTEWQKRRREDAEQPLYEMLSEVFDFADPELWKSNSFAAMRPRLIVHLEAVVANLERQRVTGTLYKGEERLAKAREILEVLQKH